MAFVGRISSLMTSYISYGASWVQVSISDLTPIHFPRLIYRLILDADQLSSKDGKTYNVIYSADIDMDYIF